MRATSNISRSRVWLASFAFVATTLTVGNLAAERYYFTPGVTPEGVIVIDNSGSMDFAIDVNESLAEPVDEGEEVWDPLMPDPDEPSRLALIRQAFNGPLDYFVSDNDTAPAAGLDRPWNLVSFDGVERPYGLTQLLSPNVYLGGGTFDDFDHLYPVGRHESLTGSNYGLAGPDAPFGGLSWPLPLEGHPTTDGATLGWRMEQGQNLYDLVANITTREGTWIAAAADDISYLMTNHRSVENNPFAACQPFFVILATDGKDTSEGCPGDVPGELDCATYTTDYPNDMTAAISAIDAPVYVISLADATEPIADGLAVAGGTGEAFTGTDLTSLSHSLGIILNNVVGGVESTIVPVTITSTDGELGILEFSASATVLTDSAYWTGDITQTARYCDAEGVAQRPTSLSFANCEIGADPNCGVGFEQFDDTLADNRIIYTPRQDNLGSAVRPLCNFYDVACGDTAGARTDPEVEDNYNWGTGVGGVSRGDTVAGRPPGEQTLREELILNGNVSYVDEEVDDLYIICLDGETIAVSEELKAQLLAEGREALEEEMEDRYGIDIDGGSSMVISLGECDNNAGYYCLDGETRHMTNDQYVHYNNPHSGHEVTIGECQLDVCVYPDAAFGTFVTTGEPAGTTTVSVDESDVIDYLIEGAILGACPDEISTGLTRAQVETALAAERSETIWVNNDLQPPPDVDQDYPAMDLDGDGLVVFDATVVYDDAFEHLGASSYNEISAIGHILEGHPLSDIQAANLPDRLAAVPDLALFDRPSEGWLGAFINTTLATLTLPAPCRISGGEQISPTCARTSEGWLDYADVVRGADRPPMLFAHSIDGQLNAFNAFTRELLWSFVPRSVIPRLGSLLYGRATLLDGPITVAEVICGYDDETGVAIWCPILAGAFGYEGSGVYVLRIKEDGNPEFLWEFTGTHAGELGRSTSPPLVINTYLDEGGGVERVNGVVVLGGGRPVAPEHINFDTSEIVGNSLGEIITIFQASNGRLLRQFDPISHPTLFQLCGAVTGAPTAWTSELARTVVMGSQYGCVLQIDMSNPDPLAWRLRVLDKTGPGMITHPIAIAQRADGRLVFVYAQGLKNFELHPGRQYHVVSVNESTTLNTGAAETIDLDVRAHVNWEIVLDESEIVTTPPLILDGKVWFASFAANTDVCDFGYARVWSIDFIGDHTVDGEVLEAPYQVDATSARLLPITFANPDYDPEDEESPEFVAYYNALQLNEDPLDDDDLDRSVIFDLSLRPDVNCATITGHDQFGNEVVSYAGNPLTFSLQARGSRYTDVDPIADDGWVGDATVTDIDLNNFLGSFTPVGIPTDLGVEWTY